MRSARQLTGPLRKNSNQSETTEVIFPNEIVRDLILQLSPRYIFPHDFHEDPRAPIDTGNKIDFNLITEKPSYWPSSTGSDTSAIFKRLQENSLYKHRLNSLKQKYGDKDNEGQSALPDDFGSTFRGTQLDGYFNRTSKNSAVSPDFFKPSKTEVSDEHRELEHCTSEFYRLYSQL